MNKESWLSILRSALTLAGTFVVGHNLLGHAVDSNTFEIIAGSVSAIAGTVWGIFDKTTGPEQLASLVRSLLIGIGGVGVSWGLISANVLTAVTAFATAILPIILSQTSKATVQQIVAGTVAPVITSAGVVTGKVAPQVPPKPDANIVQEPKKP